MDFLPVELERKLTKLDEELHIILSTVRNFATKSENVEQELKDFQKLVERIGKNRISEEDTTEVIREMRDRSYEL